ncbi:MAG: MFS transporter [Candidatus Acidiferrales bacterium]
MIEPRTRISGGGGAGIGGSSQTTSGRSHAIAAGLLGFTFDAFDFFVVVFLVGTLSTAFHVDKSAIVWAMTLTLAMRPVGAFLFGLLSDRYGRRIPLMVNVIYFSVIEVLCGFSPNYTFFLVMRALFGIGMGGEWGIGASLTMEAAPVRWRGWLSGALQGGYPLGYLLAAVAARFVLPVWGWRSMFFIGAIPALLALYIRARVPESEAWQQHRAPSMLAVLRSVARDWKNFAYLVAFMAFMPFLSHGTQDLYPDFLRTVHHVAAATISNIAILYNVCAILGGIAAGQFSQWVGRRKSMVTALVVALISIPIWAFGGNLRLLVIGACLMQVGAQGTWGVIPVHLNELSPDHARGLVPGFAYQIGILIAAPTNSIEYALRDRFGYQWALAGFEFVTIIVLIVLVSLGTERHGRSFSAPAPSSG